MVEFETKEGGRGYRVENAYIDKCILTIKRTMSKTTTRTYKFHLSSRDVGEIIGLPDRYDVLISEDGDMIMFKFNEDGETKIFKSRESMDIQVSGSTVDAGVVGNGNIIAIEIPIGTRPKQMLIRRVNSEELGKFDTITNEELQNAVNNCTNG